MRLSLLGSNLGKYIDNHLGEGNVNRLLKDFSDFGIQSHKIHFSWDWLQDRSGDVYIAWAKNSNGDNS